MQILPINTLSLRTKAVFKSFAALLGFDYAETEKAAAENAPSRMDMVTTPDRMNMRGRRAEIPGGPNS